MYATAEALSRLGALASSDAARVAACRTQAEQSLAEAGDVYAAAFDAERLALRAFAASTVWADTVAVAPGTTRTSTCALRRTRRPA